MAYVEISPQHSSGLCEEAAIEIQNNQMAYISEDSKGLHFRSRQILTHLVRYCETCKVIFFPIPSNEEMARQAVGRIGWP